MVAATTIRIFLNIHFAFGALERFVDFDGVLSFLHRVPYGLRIVREWLLTKLTEFKTIRKRSASYSIIGSTFLIRILRYTDAC